MTNGHFHGSGKVAAYIHPGGATSAWQVLAAGDHNGDGIDDLAWRNTSNGQVSIWKMTASAGVATFIHPGSASGSWTNIALPRSSVTARRPPKGGRRGAVAQYLHPGGATSAWSAV